MMSDTEYIPYWYVTNVRQTIDGLTNTALKNAYLVAHATQSRTELQFMLSADHFGNTWALYISILNVTDPNSPINLEPLMCVDGKDNWDVIKPLLRKVLDGENGIIKCFSDSVVEIEFPEFENSEEEPLAEHTETQTTDVSKFL